MDGSGLTARQLSRMLDVVGAAHECVAPAELAALLVRRLSDLIPCDLVSYNEIRLRSGVTQTIFEPEIVGRGELEQAFAAYVHQHPLVQEYDRTRDPTTRRMSDHIDQRDLRRLDLYDQVFRPLSTRYQLAFSVALEDDLVVGIGLNRWGRDFSDRHVAISEFIRPHLAAAFDHVRLRATLGAARAVAATSVLTAREHEVVVLVARGLSNKQVARGLSISARTVEKHLANAMRKVEAPNRTALAASLLGDVPETTAGGRQPSSRVSTPA